MRVAPMLANARSEKDALETVNRDPVQRRGVWTGSKQRQRHCILYLSVYLDPQVRQNCMLKFLFRENMEMSPATYPKTFAQIND